MVEQSLDLADEATLNAQISTAIRTQRLRLGLSQRQLERALGMAESTFSRYESGQRSVSAAMLCRIAVVLNLPPSAFLPQERLL